MRPSLLIKGKAGPWLMTLFLLAHVLRGSPAPAAGAEVEDPDDAANAVGTKAVADGLGNPKEYQFKAADPAGQRVELIVQLKARHPMLANMPAESIALDRLADYLLGSVSMSAGDFNPRDPAQRKVDDYTVSIGYQHFNLFRTVEQGLLASRLPNDFRSALQRFHADEIIAKRTHGRDAWGMAQDLVAIPAGWETVKVTDATSLLAEMHRRCPALATLEGAARKHALDWIAAVNPCLRGAGFYMAQKGKVAEEWIHTVLPGDGDRVRVALYEFVPGSGPALLPGADGLKGLPSSGPSGAYDCTLPVITGAQAPRRIVVRLRPSGTEPCVLGFCTLVLEAPAGDGRIERGYARLEPLCNLPQRLIAGLTLTDGRLSGQADLRVRFDDRGAFDRWIIRLDGAVAGGRIAGTFSAFMPAAGKKDDARSRREGTVAGLLVAGADVDDAARRVEADKALAAIGAAPLGGDPIGADYPRPMGPIGSGEAPPCGKAMVEWMSAARLVWRSEQETPGSYFDAGGRTPGHWFGIQGGYAAPVIAGGAAYATYYWPPTDDVFDLKYLAAHSNLGLNANNAYYYPDGPFPREVLARKAAVGADDVVLCLDGATGRTRWKATFVGKGYNHGFQGRGAMISTKTGPVTEATVTGGRVYHLGSSGRVYCLDAGTGALLWESSIGWRHDAIEHWKRACRRNHEGAGSGYDLCSSPAVVGGVVVLNDHTEYKSTQRRKRCGLVALDVVNGKVAWKRPELCGGWLITSPLRWVHGGQEFAITHSEQIIHCLDWRTGATVWELKGFEYGHKTVMDGDHLVLNQKGTVHCYKISPKGATLLWKSPRNLNVGTAAIVGKRVFFNAAPAVCLDLETGAEVGTAPGASIMSQMATMDDRVFCEAASTGALGIRMYRVSGARGLEPMGTLNVPVANCVGPAVAEGRLIVRTLDAMCCYELRKERSAVAADSGQLFAAALSDDERLAAAATVACAMYGDAVVPAVRAALEEALKKKDATRFVRVADIALVMGTNGAAVVVEPLVAALGGRGKETALTACGFSPKVWPHVTQESLRVRLLKSLVSAAKGSDAGLAKAALRTLGGFGPAADSIAEELKTGVDPDLAADVTGALKKIYAAEQEPEKPGTSTLPAKPKEIEIPVPTLDL